MSACQIIVCAFVESSCFSNVASVGLHIGTIVSRLRFYLSVHVIILLPGLFGKLYLACVQAHKCIYYYCTGDIVGDDDDDIMLIVVNIHSRHVCFGDCC